MSSISVGHQHDCWRCDSGANSVAGDARMKAGPRSIPFESRHRLAIVLRSYRILAVPASADVRHSPALSVVIFAPFSLYVVFTECVNTSTSMGLRSHSVIVALLVTAMLSTVLIAVTTDVSSAGPGVTALPETPRSDTPVATDGRGYAGAQVGNRILVGGNFSLVEPQPGDAAINLANLYIYDAGTGLLDANQFDIDGRVDVIIAAAEPDQVYIGGRFNTVNGITKRKVAKLDLSNGTVVTGFTSQGDGTVRDLALNNGTLYLTGSFVSLNALDARGLAAIDATTGAVDTSFSLPLTTYYARYGGSIGQRIEVTPDGTTLVVMHRARYVDGEERRGVAMVDISGPVATLTDWQTNLWDAVGSSGFMLNDGAMSPDGTYLVLVNGAGDGPPWRDTAIAFPVAGQDNVETLWVNRLHDSAWAVEIDDDAVYVGGHFCWIQGPDAPDPWDDPRPGGARCPNKDRNNDTNVYRDSIGALDPTTGKAIIDWVPWSDAFNGIRSLELIDDGLLVGGDQTRTSDIRTGRSAFFAYADAGPTNLALGQAASQSSTTSDADAERAVDGNRNPDWFTMTLTATTNELQPWWEVDLGSVNQVGTVQLWNRADCCADRLADVWVFTSETPFVSDDPAVLSVDPDVESVFLAGVQGLQTDVTVGAQARYVRVQLNGSNYLTLAEVRVFEGQIADNIDPTVTITDPAADDTIAAPVDLLGNASDNIGIETVQLQLRNRDTNQWLRADGTWGAWQRFDISVANPGATTTGWSHQVTNIDDGRYSFWVFAKDAAGNTSLSDNRKFDVLNGVADNIDPTGIIVNPIQDSTIPSPVTLDGTAADNVGVTNVAVELRNRDTNQWLRVDGTLGAWELLTANLDNPGATATDWEFITPVLPDGRYKMWITVSDAAGNSTERIERRFELSTP